MLVKSILGAIKYDGIVYGEGQEFEIKEEHFKSLQDNVVVVKSEETDRTTDETIEAEKDGRIDFTSWTVEELRKFAKDADVPLKSSLTKSEIIKILETENFKED